MDTNICEEEKKVLPKKKEEKVPMNIVVIGDFKSGKSTTFGHFFYKLGGIDANQMRCLEERANMINKESYRYAWVLDKLERERECGATLDISLLNFETAKYNCIIIDTPGHRDYIKNRIRGTSVADCAVIVIDSTASFEAGLELGQTHENIYILKAIDVKYIICCCNKMDATIPAYSESRFNEIKGLMRNFLMMRGWSEDQISFVAISGLMGENLTKRSTYLGWDNCPTLFDAIDQIKITAPNRSTGKALRLPVLMVGSKEVGKVFGRVESGVIMPNTRVIFSPKELSIQVESLKMQNKIINETIPGGIMTLVVKKDDAKKLKGGYIASDPENDPAKEDASFEASILIINSPTKSGKIRKGYIPSIHCHTSHTSVNFNKISVKKGKNGKKERDPEFLEKGDLGIVEMIPTGPMVVEPFNDYPRLGCFVLSYHHKIFAIGRIKSVTKRDASNA